MSVQLARRDQSLKRPCAARHPCEVPTTCQPPYGWTKDPWPAVIRDIATDGLSLFLGRRFERGSGLAIELPGPDGIASTVLARVAGLTAHHGGWLIDCHFISELGDEEVFHVLQHDPLHQAMLGETELVSDITTITSTIVNGVLFRAVRRNGEVLRWFVKRLDLYGCWPLERGKRVQFRVGGQSANVTPLVMKVHRCVLIGSFWIVDGKMRESPGEDILQLLASGGCGATGSLDAGCLAPQPGH